MTEKDIKEEIATAIQGTLIPPNEILSMERTVDDVFDAIKEHLRVIPDTVGTGHGQRTLEAELRNKLSPIYALADNVLAYLETESPVKDKLGKIISEQILIIKENKKAIDDVLQQMETKVAKVSSVYRPTWLTDDIAKNTIEIYKNLDKKEYVAGQGNSLMHAIKYLRDQADVHDDKDFTIGKCREFIENFSNQ